MFLVVNTGTKSFGNSSIFAFNLLLFTFVQNSVFTFPSCCYRISDILLSMFQMELNDYPHFFLIEDGRLCSTGLHCQGFPRVLFDALICLGYDGDALIYSCRLSMAHGVDVYKCNVMIPVNPTECGRVRHQQRARHHRRDDGTRSSYSLE
jgi:hypothetical protein